MRNAIQRPNWFIYVPFWLLIVAMFLGLMIIQIGQYNDYRSQLNALIAEYDYQRQEAERLSYELAFYGTDAFIEQQARERLRFVRPDEILFRVRPPDQ